MITAFILITLLQRSAFCQVIAIDYGNSGYKVALIKPASPLEIMLNRESKRVTSPCIGFKDNIRHIGTAAINLRKKSYPSVFCSFQKLLGRTFESESVRSYLSQNPDLDIMKDEKRGVPVFRPKEFDMSFTVEELVAQIMNESSTISGGVKAFVMTVPPTADYSAINSLKLASKIIKGNMLGIVDTSTAAAYKYVINKKAEILESDPFNLMIFDVGAATTTATIIKVSNEKTDGGKQARADILGLGFQPIGGDHITECVYGMLFRKLEEVCPEAEKLLKNRRKEILMRNEAEKLKIVFSTATETTFFLEQFCQDRDFFGKFTRAEFEETCEKIFEEITSSIDQSFTSANLSKNDIKSLVLMGRGSRTFSLHPFIKRRIGKKQLSGVLNTEDSNAIGAVFKAAAMSKQFRVAKISVHSAVVFPLEITYAKDEKDENTESTKKIMYSKVIYPHMSSSSQKRVFTIKNVTSNLTFTLRHGDMPEIYRNSHISLMRTDNNLLEVLIYGVEDQIRMNPNGIFESIKITFGIDSFGMIQVLKADAKFEKKPEKSTFSKVMDSISNAFGFGGNSSESNTTTEVGADVKFENFPNQTGSQNSTNSILTSNSTTTNNETEKTTENSLNKTASNSTKVESIPFYETLPLKFIVNELFYQGPDDGEISASYFKLKKLLLRELKREAEAKAKSDLEAFLFSTKERIMAGNDYHSVLNEEELSELSSLLEETDTWFNENGYLADYDINTAKHKSLLIKFSVAEDRLMEAKNLTIELENFYQISNLSFGMIAQSLKMPGAQEALNDSYLQNLTEFINKTTENIRQLQNEQQKLRPYQKSILTSETVKSFSTLLHGSIDQMFNEIRKSTYKKKTTHSSKSQDKSSFNETTNTDNSTNRQKDSNADSGEHESNTSDDSPQDTQQKDSVGTGAKEKINSEELVDDNNEKSQDSAKQKTEL